MKIKMMLNGTNMYYYSPEKTTLAWMSAAFRSLNQTYLKSEGF
jgi:hypothetical protein